MWSTYNSSFQSVEKDPTTDLGSSFHSFLSPPNQYSSQTHTLAAPPDTARRRSGSPHPLSSIRSPSHLGVGRRRHSDLSLLQQIFVQPSSSSSDKSRSSQSSPKSYKFPLSFPEPRMSAPHEDHPIHGRAADRHRGNISCLIICDFSFWPRDFKLFVYKRHRFICLIARA